MKLHLLIVSILITTNVFCNECDTINKTFGNIKCDTSFFEDDFSDLLLNDKEHSIELDSLALINIQLDSILYIITGYLNEKAMFFTTLMREGDELYLEIIKCFSNNDLVSYYYEIKSSGGYIWNKNRKIYGYFKYKDCDFVVFGYAPPNTPTVNDFNMFFYNTLVKKIIFEEKDDFPHLYENPMWLYQCFPNKLVLLNSVNDKDFYTKEIERTIRFTNNDSQIKFKKEGKKLTICSSFRQCTENPNETSELYQKSLCYHLSKIEIDTVYVLKCFDVELPSRVNNYHIIDISSDPKSFLKKEQNLYAVKLMPFEVYKGNIEICLIDYIIEEEKDGMVMSNVGSKTFVYGYNKKTEKYKLIETQIMR